MSSELDALIEEFQRASEAVQFALENAFKKRGTATEIEEKEAARAAAHWRSICEQQILKAKPLN